MKQFIRVSYTYNFEDSLSQFLKKSSFHILKTLDKLLYYNK